MEKINDIIELSDLISSYFKKGILTNNYTMLSDYKNYIEREELFFEEIEGGMLIFRDCESHWKVFYYLRDFSEDYFLPQDKPSVMEIIFHKDDDKNQNVFSYWESRGFQPYLMRNRMSMISTKFNIEHTNKKYAGFAKSNNALAIQKMISNTFDCYLGDIPSLLEVRQAIDEKKIISVENIDGQIDGVLHIDRKHNVYYILHLVVDPRARKKGYAKEMLLYLDSIISKDEKIKIQLWVREDNLPAICLYENAGFQYDGWKSIGFLYQPENIN